jgi:peptidoglycan/LPS O-acetylase OafA/YrhL
LRNLQAGRRLAYRASSDGLIGLNIRVSKGAIDVDRQPLLRMESRPSPARPKAPTRKLQSLTSLRGLAALWVVLYHYSTVYFPRLDIGDYSNLIAKGYLAVDLFFMLSGFVMTHVYYRAFSESITQNYRNFLVARIARLYPLHLLVLFLFLATALTSQLLLYMRTGSFHGIPLEGARSMGAFAANLFMLQGLAAGKLSWNYPAWSISVEFLAYLGFPFALPLIWRAHDAVKFALALFLFAVLGLLAFVTKDDFNQWNGPITLLRCLPEFILGTLLYCAYRSGFGAAVLKLDYVATGIVAATIVSLHLGGPDFLTVILFAGLILAAVSNSGAFAQAINVAPLVWLGDISYSLYLIHGFVQFLATKLLESFGLFDRSNLSTTLSLVSMTVMVAVCLISAAITYFSVEIAWRKYLRNFLGSTPDQARSPATPSREASRA